MQLSKTYSRTFPSNRVIVNAGGYFVSNQRGLIISTLLGSCVAACLWDASNGIIGMNHFLLVEKRGTGSRGFCRTEAGRYGVYAMELLVDGMMKLGALRENLRAKVAGGTSVIKIPNGDSYSSTGELNKQFILEFLRTDGIPLISADLGGDVGRVIYFSSTDYSLYVRKMGKVNQQKVIENERRLWKQAARKPAIVPEPEIWL